MILSLSTRCALLARHLVVSPVVARATDASDWRGVGVAMPVVMAARPALPPCVLDVCNCWGSVLNGRPVSVRGVPVRACVCVDVLTTRCKKWAIFYERSPQAKDKGGLKADAWVSSHAPVGTFASVSKFWSFWCAAGRMVVRCGRC